MHLNWPALDLKLWQRIIFFEFPIGTDGRIKKTYVLLGELRQMSAAAASCGSALDIAFTQFDEEDFEKLFSSPASRQSLLHQIIDLADSANAAGVHIDIEIYKQVTSASVIGFRKFIDDLSGQLRREAPRRLLTAFGVIGAAQDLFDTKTITALDYTVVQGYDAHWPGGGAGPISPIRGNYRLTWEKALHYYLRLGAKRSQLVFGIPYYGYEWPTESEAPVSQALGQGREITYAPVPLQWVPAIPTSALEQSKRYGLLRDAQTGSPYYAYRDSQGQWHQGWFENEISVAEKISFIQREGVAGVAAFPLGYDAAKFDLLLKQSFGERPSCRASENTDTPSKLRK